MRDRLDTIRFASRGGERLSGQRGRLIRAWAWIGIASVLVGAGSVAAQDVSMMPLEEMGGIETGAPPMMSMGDGSYFSQDLGTMVRARFVTPSYGQDERLDGQLDIGTMQVVNWDDATAFFDAQVTLSDVQGTGFNVGIGYRWLSWLPYATDTERITGVSIWGDGTSTEADNFFPQLGLSFESLGDIWDLRANAYVPIGQDSQVGNFVPTGVIGFQDHFISELSRATVDQSFYAAEFEVARRLGRERDAWGFVGAYELANDIQDTTGGRAGFRGYAYPDLLLQVAVTHDDIFDTNTTFSLTWFIGRTRTNFHPACGVRDRFREPVMRNDYVALSQSTALGGDPLTDADGNPFRVTHVDSNAAPGGDGTFERPLNNLDEIQGNSQAKDIVFVHANSEFTGQEATLLAQQRFLGEGDGIEHVIVTEEEGTIPIPESSPGAADAPRPLIFTALGGDAVTITDRNEVANFTIEGGARAIVAGVNGAGNPNLHDLTISDTTSDAIVLTPFVRTDSEDSDNDGNLTEQFVEFNVTIRDVTFDNIGGDDINMDAFTSVDVDDPNVTLQETIALTDIDSTDGGGRGVFLANTHEDGTFTLTNYTNMNGDSGSADEGRLQFNDIDGDITVNIAEITGGAGYALSFLNVDSPSSVSVTEFDYDGMTGAAGAIRLDTFDGVFNIATSTLQNGTLNGIRIINQSDGTFTFQSTVEITNLGNIVGGIAFEIDGDPPIPAGTLKQFTGVVNVAADIENDLGRSLVVRNITGAGTAVTFTGDITDTGQGIFINENSGGIILLSGEMNLDTLANTAVLVQNNTGADINFAGAMDIDTTSGNGFEATGGGTLTVSNTGNDVQTDTGQLVRINDMTISNTGANFGHVDRDSSAATNAVELDTNTGGPILIGTVGDDPGDSGTIAAGTADSILVQDSANVTISGLIINNSGAFSGIQVNKTLNNVMIVNVNDVTTNDGDIGLEVLGNGTTANLNMSINDTIVNNATDIGMLFNNVDNGNIDVNDADISGGGATAGIRILNSNATFDFDSDTSITDVSGTDFDVNGGTPNITMAGDITNTAGLSVQIQNVTGGTTNFTATSSITDTGGGMRMLNNSGGTFSFLGTNDFDPLDNIDAILLTNNTGATMSFANLSIDTTNGAGTATGRGFVATGGGTVSITGLTNTIDTDAGTGLQLENMTIGAVDLQRVTVDGTAAPTNAIIMRNLIGGQATVGSSSGAQNSGGVLRSTGDAIVLENVANADFNHVQIVNAGGIGVNIDHTNTATTAMDITFNDLNLDASTGLGIDVDGASSQTLNLRLNNSDIEERVVMDSTGTGPFKVLLDNTDITTAGADVALAITFGDTSDGDVTIRNGSTIEAGNARGFEMFVNGGGTTVAALFESSSFTSASAEDMFIENTVGAQTDLTIRNNTFFNSSAGNDALIRSIGSAGAGTRVNLNLVGNGAAASTIRLFTDEDAAAPFNFGVVDLTNVNANNPANVVLDPAAANFEDIDTSDVQLPNGP